MESTKHKTILLLGGSPQQVPAIEAAKELQYRTVLIDYLPDNPGRYVADVWYQESTTDINAVCRIAKHENVCGILAYASDPAALPAAIVCERLGLPTNPASSVEILGVKHKFRKFLQENGFPCPATYIFSPDDSYESIMNGIGNLRFPIVVKPTDSSGSKGVSFLNDYAGLSEAIKFADTYSRNKILIAEEFIERGFPDVIGGDIFVENGKIILYGEMACLRGDNGRSLIPIGEKKPSGLSDKQKALLYSELQKLIYILGIKAGEFNIEVLIDGNDMPHFLEVGPRAGGNMIPIELSDAYGINLIEANIKAAIGESVQFNLSEPDDSFMTYVLHSSCNGIFSHVYYDRNIEKYIYRKIEYKKPGDIIEAFDGAGKAVGIIFMRFPSSDIMNEVQAKLEQLIKVVVK